MLRPDKVVSTDILVVGGGLAGSLAALRAKELLDQRGEVLLIDKGYVSRSGQSAFAAGIFTAYDPETDELMQWLEEIITFGEYLNDQEWARKHLLESMDVVKMLESWASEEKIEVFKKGSDGKLVRRQSRGHYRTKHLLVKALPLMKMLRNRALRLGVKIIDRIMVTDILVEDGIPYGVLGLSLREDKIYFFQSKVIVLAASGCGFKATMIGHQNLTGDLQTAAFEAGVIFRNMEQYASNTTSKYYDIHGLNLFVGIGGQFINGLGEEFMSHYDPTLRSRARLQDLVLAFCREVMEGRGPIYLDMQKASDEDQRLCREILPETFLLWDRAGIDPFKQPMEWVPSSYATCICGGGIQVNTACETNLPFLFAAGDITCIPIHGTYTFGGLCLSWCGVSGRQAAESAVKVCSEGGTKRGKSFEELMSDHIRKVLSPLDAPRTISVHEYVKKLQQLIIPIEVGYLKSISKLLSCLEESDRLEREDLPRIGAVNSHELMRAIECRSMTRIAQLLIKASILRTESRGWHFRQDYPTTDNVNWLKWLLLSRSPGHQGTNSISPRTHDVATPYFRPIEEYSVPPGVRRV